MAGDGVPAWRSDNRLIRWGAYAWAFAGLAVAIALTWKGLSYIRIVVVPFSLAIFLAAILTPPSRWLEERRFPPALAAFTTLLAFVVILGGIGYAVTLNVQSQYGELRESLVQTYRDVQPRFDNLPFLPPADDLFGEVTSSDGEGSDEVDDGGGDGDSGSGAGSDGSSEDEASPSIGQSAREAAVAAVEGTATFVTELFLFIVATFFYIKDRRPITRFLAGLFPRERRSQVAEMLREVWATVGGYIRGQAIIATVDGVLVAIGLLIAGIPLALTLGVVVFLGAFVPVVGSITAGVLAVAVGLASQGLSGGLIALAIVVGVQQFEGNVLAPVILGRTVEIHPLAVLGSVTAGAVLLGIWGAIIGVPLAASLYRIAEFLRRNDGEAPTDGTAAEGSAAQ